MPRALRCPPVLFRKEGQFFVFLTTFATSTVMMRAVYCTRYIRVGAARKGGLSDGSV